MFAQNNKLEEMRKQIVEQLLTLAVEGAHQALPVNVSSVSTVSVFETPEGKMQGAASVRIVIDLPANFDDLCKNAIDAVVNTMLENNLI